MRQVPFGKPMIDDHERQAVMEVMKGDILVHGPKAKEFEKAFAALTGAPHAIAVSSCTAALHLLYFYLQLGTGDEVIVPAQTHTATAHAVELVGAKPVFVDAERETGNIDITQIEKAITPRTKAISVVHFLGMPVDMDKVNAIAQKHGLFVVEDAALAVGTYFKGVHAGLLGDAGCFSFYPVKHITTAEGGAITTRDPAMALKLERQKAFGVDRTVGERKVPGVYDVTMLGFNYRMNEIEAAIGIEQIKKVPMILERRRSNYEALEKKLRSIGEIELLRSSHGDFQSSYYCLSVILADKLVSKRFEIVEMLKASGVGTSVYYPRPVPHMTYYRQKYGYTEAQFPMASRISYKSIALPVGPHLNEEDMAYIANALKEALARHL
jgi:dTDP-4-amino-4,6-dideoxygalactose transaminase